MALYLCVLNPSFDKFIVGRGLILVENPFSTELISLGYVSGDSSRIWSFTIPFRYKQHRLGLPGLQRLASVGPAQVDPSHQILDLRNL